MIFATPTAPPPSKPKPSALESLTQGYPFGSHDCRGTYALSGEALATRTFWRTPTSVRGVNPSLP